MSQPTASSPQPEGGAPGPEGQGPGAGELALREEIKKIRERIRELQRKLLELEENVNVSEQMSILTWFDGKLDLASMYLTLIEIEQQARAGSLDWYGRNRLRAIITELNSMDSTDDPLFFAVKEKAERVQKFVDAMNAMGELEEQIDKIATEVKKIEREILKREGWDVE